MNTVIVPADEAQWLFKLTPPLRKFPARSFVVHTANIEATTCETCGGSGEDTHIGAPRENCGACNGEGTIPAVVTLAVTHEFGRYPGLTADILGFRPVGTATVAHCWPIVARYSKATDNYVRIIDDEGGRVGYALHRDGVVTDITGQVVGTPTPGAFLLELADVELAL